MATSSLILNPSLCSSSSKQRRIITASINISNRVGNISLPGIRNADSPINFMDTFIKNEPDTAQDPLIIAKLYVILEAVSDRVEMHKSICDQRSNWNTLLLTSTNALILAAATMAGIASISGGSPEAAMKLSSTIMYVGATGLLSIMNKIQPSQLAEEQRNATRLFKQLEGQIRTIISIGNPTSFDVKELMEKVLALDKAYPLPLLGAMLEKFPDHVEPAVWWPECRRKLPKAGRGNYNGWNKKLEDVVIYRSGRLRARPDLVCSG